MMTKDERNAYQRAYYAKNREKILAYMKRWRNVPAHYDVLLARQAAYEAFCKADPKNQRRAAVLVDWMSEHGVTQAWIARKIGMTQCSISRYVHSGAMIRPEKFAAIPDLKRRLEELEEAK